METSSDTSPIDSQLDRRLRDGLGDVGQAFFNFPSLSAIQRAAIPVIATGSNALVCAATAAGKTEAVIAPLTWAVRRTAAPAGSGPRLLAVAPTRALVADLVARLETPLARLGWRCAAQTSDFAGADSEPEFLITTPESLDSMLVRRVRREGGEFTGHLLANVAGVFVDEAHCFDCTPRGDQLMFLLARLRKLRETARTNGWTTTAEFQICAASATVPEPQVLAERLLGAGAQAIVCPGSRPIDILTSEGDWMRLDDNMRPSDLAPLLPRATDFREVCDLIELALRAEGCRKALVFVSSRKQCDLLARDLRSLLRQKREIWVDAHHGSLSREHRRNAEDSFNRQRDAVLVATNTLEVGVDIGDVDVVVLLGSPADTASLLQRIGRGGRRVGLTRIIPMTRHAMDAAAMASELTTAVQGELEHRIRIRRWDVLPQQVISYIRQNRGSGRSKATLAELTAAVWREADTVDICAEALRAWILDGRLEERRGRLHIAGAWDRFAEQADDDATVHSNINSTGVALAVRDERSGEIIGHIERLDEGQKTITLGGQSHRIVHRDEELIVTPATDRAADAKDDTPNYGGRRRPVSEPFAAHVGRGCGFDLGQTPVVQTPEGLLWFHFGGELFATMLRKIHPRLILGAVLPGVAFRVVPGFETVDLLRHDSRVLQRFIENSGISILGDDGLGRFASDLPAATGNAFLAEHRLLDRFTTWLSTRTVTGLTLTASESAFEAVLEMARARVRA